ncbi:MAG: hypothetical protein LZF86_110606 [Nitrospira sp.]|nr:MAG: hypothetical protein LZF86_110606 [Nitrospira sp.]
MTDAAEHGAGGGGSLEGRVFRPVSAAETIEAIDLAFDYRGDVTLELRAGESLSGYIYNRHMTGANPAIEIFPADNPVPRKIPYADIAAIAFTGEDTANGNSWEAWTSKKESERRAEADRVEADARARGLL